MDNQFENKGKDQNVGQGDGAIGKQVNNYYPSQTAVIPCQLPPLDTCFLGRDKDLTNLVDQLHPGKVVAVCGPGGMGKSALAAQAVHKLEKDRFLDGIVFHSFYGHPETEQALQTICAAFQIEAKARLETTVKGLLANRKALLILDGAEEADDLKAVLDLRSTCGVLITSRKRSDAQAEKLRLDLKPLDDKPAVDVFCEYSGAVANDAGIQGICTILGGWPVGLRVAGRYLSTTGESAADYLCWLEQEPFKELGDGEHQEENAALLLRRSVTQVSDDARLALGFAGTLAFAPIAREPVAAILDDDERRARKALGELVNYGLMEKPKERWKISHALIHTYARTDLALNRERLERLASWYIDFCETQSVGGEKGYACLDGERAHWLRLIENCLASKLWKEVKDLEEAMWEYLDRQGYWAERLTALEMRLDAARNAGYRKNEGVCLNNLGYTCERRGELDKALAWYEQSLSVCRELGARKEEGTTLNNMAEIFRQQGKYEQALGQYEQSLSIQREIGDPEGQGVTLNNIGLLYYALEDYEQALFYYEQALPIMQEAGDEFDEGRTLNNIASLYYTHGKYSNAIEYHEQALAIFRKVDDRAGEAVTYWNIGFTYHYMGNLVLAEEYIALAVQIAEQIGHPALEQFRKGLEQVRAARQGA